MAHINNLKQMKPQALMSHLSGLDRHAKMTVLKQVHRKQLEHIGNKVDTGVMAPSQQIYYPDLESVMEYIDSVVERYAMNTELFNAPNFLSPAYFGFYLEMVFLIYIKKYGQLTGASSGNIPTNFDEWAIPLPFAQFLEGFGTYTEDGSVHRNAVVHDSPIGVENYFWGFNDLATNLAVRTLYPSTWLITICTTQLNFEMLPTTSPAEFPGFIPIDELSFSSALISAVSEAISAAGLAYVTGKSLIGTSPDGSGYAFVNNDVATLAPGQCVYFASPIDNFNAESALIYSKHRVNPTANSAAAKSLSRKCVCMGTDDIDNPVIWYMQPVRMHVWLRSMSKNFSHTPLHNIKYCHSDLTTLFPVAIELDWRGFAHLVNHHYGVLYGSYNITGVGTGNDTGLDVNLELLAASQIVAFMAMWTRFLRAIPYFRQYFLAADQTSYTPQQFMGGTAWLNTRLPVSISDAIAAVGPVVYRGRLYYPTFPVRTFATVASVTTSPGPVWSMGTAGWNYELVKAAFNLGIVFGDGLNHTAATLQLGFGGGTALTLNDFSTIPPANFFIVYTLNYHSTAVLKIYYGFHSSLSTNLSMNKSLVHQHYNKCGAGFLLLNNFTGGFTTNLDGAFEYLLNNNTVHDSTGVVQFITVPVVSIAQSASLIQLSSAEMYKAMTYCMNITDNATGSKNPLNDGKFIYQVPTVNGVGNLIAGLLQATYSVGNSFSDAVAARESKFSVRVGKRGIITPAMAPDNPDNDCWVSDLFNTVTSILGDGLRYGIKTAAGAACSAGATFVGAPEMSSLAESGCSAAAESAFNYVASRVSVEANDIFPTTGTIRAPVADLGPGMMMFGVKSVSNDIKKDAPVIPVQAVKVVNPAIRIGTSVIPKKKKKPVAKLSKAQIKTRKNKSQKTK